MMIQFNTDHNITGTERLKNHFNELITSSLHRFMDKITRIEVHLSDEVGEKTGQNDKKCVMEARVEHVQPVVVSCHANTIEMAITGAIDKLKGSLDRTFDKMKTY